MPIPLYLGEPRVVSNLGDTLYVVFPPGNPELVDLVEATAEIPVGGDTLAAIETEKPEALKRILGSVETLFPGQYAIVAAIPRRVSMSQARRALHRAGLLGQTDAAINAIPDADTRTDALIAWEYSTVVDRDDQLVQSIAQAFGLTDTDLDNLFQAASQL